MTLPVEEMRAINRTRVFLLKLLDPKSTPRVLSEIRKGAGDVLKHYPVEMRVDDLYHVNGNRPQPTPPVSRGPEYAVRCTRCNDYVPLDIGLANHRCGRPTVAGILNVLRWIRTTCLDKRFTNDEARSAIHHEASKVLERAGRL